MISMVLFYRRIKMTRALQLRFPDSRTWGGRRAGAGRRPTPGRRPEVSHTARPLHIAVQPAHVTLRTGKAIRCLRAERVFPFVRSALASSSHDGFRLLHFSAQDDHLHLIVEADSHRA